LQARSLIESETLLDSVNEDVLDVALVDGNLDEGSISGNDGEAITQLLHEKFKGIVVIGISGTGEVRGADVQCSKVGMINKIPEIISQL
jgi:hypothetical protein